MLQHFSNAWQKLGGSISGMDSSRQLAAGVALGLIIGMLPKDSLLVLGMVFVLLLSRANLLSAMCSTFVFSFIGVWLTPLTHEIGYAILTFSRLQSLWGWMAQLPLLPWTRFDNSVVMGSLVLSVAAALPTFRYSEKCFDAYGAATYTRFRNSQAICWLVGPKKPQTQEGQA